MKSVGRIAKLGHVCHLIDKVLQCLRTHSATTDNMCHEVLRTQITCCSVCFMLLISFVFSGVRKPEVMGIVKCLCLSIGFSAGRTITLNKSNFDGIDGIIH